MILIADAGATSIDWRLIQQNGQVAQAKSKGYNAFQQSEEDLRASIKDAMEQLAQPEVNSVYFYGAGISSDENKSKTEKVLISEVSAVEFFIEHDLLAAARALLLDKPGIACILGTGTNSCYYDGNNIIKIVPSLGFALGDEGSGASLGRNVIKSYLRGDMPDDLSKLFAKRYNLEEKDVLKNIYQGSTPSQYLASFAKFCFHHKRHPYIYQLIYDEFKNFFENILMKYEKSKKSPVAFNGSIAFYYSDILRQVGNDSGVAISTIMESPIAGLTLYHQNTLS